MKLRNVLMTALIVGNTIAGEKNTTAGITMWKADLSGTIIGRAGAGQGNIRENDDSGLGFRVNTELLGSRFKLDYTDLSYNTFIDAVANFTFDGKTYTAGDVITLNMDWTTWDLGWRGGNFIDWNHTNPESYKRTVGIHLDYGLQIIQADINMSAPLRATVDFDETIPVPYIGFAGESRLSRNLGIEFGIKGLNVGAGSNEVEYLDSNIGLRWFFKSQQEQEDRGSLYFGYKKRTLDIVANEGAADEARLDMDMDGLFASVEFKF